MREQDYNLFVRRACVLWLALLGLTHAARAEEPISFVFPAANFQPVAAGAYADESTPPTPPQAPEPPLTPPQAALSAPSESARMTFPNEPAAEDPYLAAGIYESATGCPTCDVGREGSGLPPGRMPNGQYHDDWMWGCGRWPYANGPGACDDWKVGPIWDVTVDGIVMTRENTDLGALEAAMAEPGAPEVVEQFDRGPGGRVFLTGLMPRDVGYQVFAGYEGIEEWNAAIVYPETPSFPPFGTPTERRSLFYRSSLHSGELNFMRMGNPTWRPYFGVRYIKFDDEIWDQNIQEVVPPLPGPPPIVTVSQQDTFNIFDIENNLIGFQGGLKYDLWQVGRRFSLQGFVNSGVYYNKAKWSNQLRQQETQFTSDDATTIVDESSSTTVSNANLTIIEQSDVAFVGEASLTGVCRLNRCWALRAGYQVLWIDGVALAQDAYLGNDLDGRSLLFHGWHAGVEYRR